MTQAADTRILVVDDDESVINILRRLFKKNGFQNIMSALNPLQALHIMETAKKPFHLVISDQVMPEMEGTELFKKVKDISPDTRRILMTGYQNFKAAVEGVNQGAIHQYISKPWENEDLLSKIRRELDLYEKVRERKQFLRLTRRQNARLFKTAKAEKEKDKYFQREIRNKKQKRAELARKAVELEKKKPFDKTVFELNSLISGNIVIQEESLAGAFRIIKQEVDELIATLCREKGLPRPAPVKNPQTGLKSDSPASDKDDMYEAVDLILQYAGRNAEPELYAYGKTLLDQFETGRYSRVPDIGELAVNEGYITQEDQIGRAHV